MSCRERQRLADIQAAIDAIRSHLQRGDLSDGLIFDAVRIRLLAKVSEKKIDYCFLMNGNTHGSHSAAHFLVPRPVGVEGLGLDDSRSANGQPGHLR